jgi:hypothetical protein
MEHICLYCATPFTAKREGKNYCSNSCRQKAFYKRNAVEPGSTGVTGTIPVAGEEQQQSVTPAAVKPATVQQESVYVKSVQPYSTDTGNSTAVVAATTQQQDIAVTATNVKDAVTATVTAAVTLPDKQTEQPSLLPGKVQAIAKPESNTSTNTFQWVSSRFNDSVEELSEKDCNVNMFHAPQRYLSAGEKEKVVWVSIRLRSLLESLLKLHRGCNTLCSQLLWVRKAFTAMQGATEFKELPAKYPYKELIKELEQGLVKITEGYGKNVPITVRYTRNRKLEMIAARFNLSALVPKQSPCVLFPPKQKEPKKVVEQQPVRKYDFGKKQDYKANHRAAFLKRIKESL